jgi:transcriptional regulator GlxA family with amidase domain
MAPVLYIPVFDGFDELDAIAPFEILASAGLDARLVVLAGRSLRVRARHGLVLEASGTVDATDVVMDDWVLAVGGGYGVGGTSGVRAEIASRELPSFFAASRERGALLASVCTGAMLLAAAGLVRGRRAITHRVAIDDLAAAGATVVNERVVDDGDLVTAGGVTSGLDLALHLVGRLLGPEAARVASQRVEYPPPR